MKTPLHVLVAETGDHVGRSFEITADGLRVGRHPTVNNVALKDPQVSSEHAQISVTANNSVELTDLKSSNGTFVNGQRVASATLEDGSSVEFGSRSDRFIYRSTAREVRAEKPQAAEDPEKPVDARPAKTLVVSSESGYQKQPTLQLVLDRYAVENKPLKAGTTTILGSQAGQDRIVLEHPTVEADHAGLTLTPDGRAQLVALQSRHGTLVNGERVQQVLLRDGDLIQLGTCERLLLYRAATRPQHTVRNIDLKSDIVTIGRDQKNVVCLDHPTVSSRHAEIRRTRRGAEIEDKGSTNGTFVNGNALRPNAPRVLDPTDHIVIGAVQLTFDGQHIGQYVEVAGVRVQAYNLVRAKDDKGKPILENGRPIRILNDVSIAIQPGELVGILGPAGSGKSTLMYALNGFHPAESGRVLLDGLDLYEEFVSVSSTIGYVPQKDILHASLTARDSLFYAARLRLPVDYSDTQIHARVAEIINLLNLADRADVPIHNLSGGQQKRVNVGIELLSKPGLLFLDEPTAGQDPLTEMQMMELFRRIARKGSTVIITTHLLGSFSLLDKVIVVVRGKLAYLGPSEEMLGYFGARRPHEVYERLKEKSADEWAAEFSKSDICRIHVQDLLKDGKGRKKDSKVATAGARLGSAVRQFTTLVHRQFKLKVQNWKDAASLLLPALVVSLLLGMMSGAANQTKILFIMVFSALWFGCSGAVREIVDERALYKRERQRNLRISSFLASKLIYCIAIGAAQSWLFVTVLTVFGRIEGHYLTMLGLVWLMTFQGSLIGLLISALAPDPEKALMAFPLVLIPELLLAGMFIPINPPDAWYPLPNQEGRIGVSVPAEINSARQEQAMRAAQRMLSVAMVSRWGLEALADLCIHDIYKPVANRRDFPKKTMPGYMLLNDVGITFHPDDVTEARRYGKNLLENPRLAAAPEQEPAIVEYTGILFLFVSGMIVAIAVALKQKDNN